MIGISDAIAITATTVAIAVPTHADDLNAAREYWGWPWPPLCKSTELRVEEPVYNPGAVAEATEPWELGVACVMRVSPGFWGEARCKAITHEYGHWLKLSHGIAWRYPIMGTTSEVYSVPVPQCMALYEGWGISRP